jgi:hypothetical protein
VVSEGSPENYEEFIRLYPRDPLSDDIRVLLYNLKVAKAWHKTVLANSPVAYKTFHENYSNSPYAPAALKLYGAPKAVPLMQFTHLAKQSPSYKHGNFGHSFAHNKSGGAMGPMQHMPGHAGSKPFGNGKMGPLSGKDRHSPFNAGKSGGNNGKFSKFSNRMNNNPMRTGNRHMFNNGPRHFGGGMGSGRFSQRFSSGPSRMSFARGGFGGGRSFGGGGFGRR